MTETRRTGGAVVDDVEASVRQLLRLVSPDDQGESGVDGEPGVSTALLDIEVDGVRCLLQRVEPTSPQRSTGLLTPREEDIARMVAAGYPNKAIASALEISAWTVSSHLRRVFAKLGVRSRAAMVARLLEDQH
jgi:DNA-binding CsgD family transcriptional regulator